MSISTRERNYVKQLIEAGKRRIEQSPDLFRESGVQQRQKTHLIFVIRRQARRLKVAAPANLDSKSEIELSEIRVSFSQEISRAKMAAPAEEIAA